VTTRSQFYPFVGDLRRGGIDLDDFETNGLLLPCREATAIRTRRPLHRGPHPRYNDIITAYLELIRHDWSRSTLPTIIARVRNLQVDIANWLVGNTVDAPTRLGKRDPFASDAVTAELDAHVESLFSGVSGRLL
jgi:hypothetical protein